MRLAVEVLIGVAIGGLVLIVEGRLRQIRRREAEALRQAQQELVGAQRAWHQRQRMELLQLSMHTEGGSEVLSAGGKGQFSYWVKGARN